MKNEIVVRAQEWAAKVAWMFARMFLRLEVSGAGNLETLLKLQAQENCGILMVANHINAHDPFFVFACVPREIRRRIFPITFLGKEELFSNAFKRFFMDLFGVIPVGNDSGRNIRNIRTALRRFKDGRVVFFFPEGAVSQDGNLGEEQGAVNFFSHCTSLILQPVRTSGIRGWNQDWLNILLFRRKLEVHFGKPLIISKGEKLDVMEVIKAV